MVSGAAARQLEGTACRLLRWVGAGSTKGDVECFATLQLLQRWLLAVSLLLHKTPQPRLPHPPINRFRLNRSLRKLRFATVGAGIGNAGLAMAAVGITGGACGGTVADTPSAS